MAEIKTKQNNQSVDAFLSEVSNEKRRQDSYTVLQFMEKVTKEEPKMWGTSIVGFGKYHYKYASGREGDTCLVGFSPRKQNLTLYIQTGFDRYEELMSKLGKFTTGKSCLYINKIEDIDLSILEQLIKNSAEHLQNH